LRLLGARFDRVSFGSNSTARARLSGGSFRLHPTNATAPIYLLQCGSHPQRTRRRTLGAAVQGQFLPPAPQKNSEPFRRRITVKSQTCLSVRDTVPDLAVVMIGLEAR
jgi:hypothetical protein